MFIILSEKLIMVELSKTALDYDFNTLLTACLTHTSNPSSPVYPHRDTLQSVILYTSITALVMNFISLRSPLTPPCSTDAAALGPIEQYSC